MPRVLQVTGPNAFELTEKPKPSPGEGQILVKVVACAQNPLDWCCLNVWYAPAHIGNHLGCDYAGVVEAAGAGVTRFQRGDAASGFVIGNLTRNGAFADYVVGDAALAVHTAALPFEQGATLGVAVATAGLALYKHLGVAFPDPPAQTPDGPYLLVYGGSSAMGTMITMLAALSGLRVVATASERNFALVEAFGAEKLFDYHDAEVARKIQEYTGGRIALAVNCIPNEQSLAIVSDSMSPTGGKCVNLVYVDTSALRKDIEWSHFVAFEIFGKPFSLAGLDFPNHDDGREVAAKTFQLVEKLIGEGGFPTHPVKVVDGGLEGVRASFDEGMQGRISGYKPVFMV